MPKIIKKKVAGSGQIEEDVMDVLGELAEKAKESKKQIAIAAVVVLAVIIMASGVFLLKKNAAQRAAMLEADAYALLMDKDANPSLSDTQRLENALAGFREANETEASPMRSYYIAGTLSKMGRYDEAIAELDSLMLKHSANKLFLPTAKFKKAMVYKQMGDMDKALATLQEISLLGGNTLKDVAIVETAQILESQGKTQEARDYYSLLLREHPNSSFARLAATKAQDEKEQISPSISPLGGNTESGSASGGLDINIK